MSGPDEIRNRFTVPFEYRILFSDGVLDPGNTVLADVLAAGGDGPAAGPPAHAAVFVDAGVHHADPRILQRVTRYFQAHRSRVALSAEPQVVPGGEAAKDGPSVFYQCVDLMRAARLDRRSYAVALGGGAVLDAVGFAASVVHRGVRQVRVPTTVLAQNDAGIGVKNAIDYRGAKNFLGNFYPPHAVVNDFTFLRTLSPSQWRDGAAEAVKVALVRDAAFFDWIDERARELAAADEGAMRVLIRRCAALHLDHIATAGDPFERGSARPLDFGHWSAHKLEQLSAFRVAHGHAVAVGMAIDSLYARRTGLLGEDDFRRVTRCLRRLGFHFDVAALAGLDGPDGAGPLMGGVEEFREHLGGELSLTMPCGIGSALEVGDVDLDLLRACAEQVLFRSVSPDAAPGD